MRHMFIGGPLHSRVFLLDVVLGDEELRLDIPWEDYERIAIGKAADGELDLVQWRHRGTVPADAITSPFSEETSETNYLIPPQEEVEGGYPTVETMFKDGYDGSARIPVEAAPELSADQFAPAPGAPPFQSASENPPETSEDPEGDEQGDYHDSIPSAPDAPDEPRPAVPEDFDHDVIWPTFEERRKAITPRFSRDRLGTDLGGTKSLGWRLESGNVSSRDVKSLGADSIAEVYFAAHQLLLSHE